MSRPTRRAAASWTLILVSGCCYAGMTEIERVAPAELQVGDLIYLNPLQPFATRELSREERRTASVGNVEVTGFGEYDRSRGTVVVRTGVFDAAVPDHHLIARVAV